MSKWCGAGGWRIGALAFPDQLQWIQNAMATVASETFSAVCAPVQYAAITAFNGNVEIQNTVKLSRRIMNHVLTKSSELMSAAGIRCAAAEGGFYLLPNFNDFRPQLLARGVDDAMALSAKLLADTGVASLPGSDFGLSVESLTLRIAQVDFDGAAALDVCNGYYKEKILDGDFSEKYVGRPIEGVKKIIEWLQSIV